MVTVSFAVSIVLCLAFPHRVQPYSYTGERSIRMSVLNSVTHDRMARPYDYTNATVGFTLLVINDLDIMTQQFEISGWFTVLWNDERLTWPPTNHDNTSFIHALEEEIWKPEVLIANAQANIGLISDDHLIYRIDYLGNVVWEPVVSSVTNCAIDVTYYPFDTQTCTMKLLSWGLPSSELTLLSLWDDVNMDSFLGNGVWEVMETRVDSSKVYTTIQNVTETFSQLEYIFKLKRNPGNYVINTLFPSAFASFLMVMVNLIPIECGERVTAAFLTIVMDAVLLSMFSDQIPDIETTSSLLGFYITFGFCLDVAWVVTSVIMTRVHFQPIEKPVYPALKFIVRVLKPMTLFFDPPPTPEEPPPEEPPTEAMTLPTDDLLKISRGYDDEESNTGTTGRAQSAAKRNSVKPEGFTEHVTSKGKLLPPISGVPLEKHKTMDKLDILSEIREKKKMKPKVSKKKRDLYMSWMVVASVFDRVLFVMFLTGKIYYNTYFITRIREAQ